METYQTAKFDSLKNVSGDIVLTDRCQEKGKKKEYEKQEQ